MFLWIGQLDRFYFSLALATFKRGKLYENYAIDFVTL